MQYGPDLVPISSQSIVIGVPTREPTPIEVTTTETIIAPPTYLTPVIQLNVSNISPPVPYVVGVSDEGSLVASKVTMLNFVGNGVAATYAGNNNVTVTVTRTLENLEAGDGIQVVLANGVATITNTGTINVASGAGISVVKAGNTTTITNTGVTSIVAGNSISVSAATGAVTVNNTFTETVYNGGNWSGTVSPNRNNGTIQKYTLTGNITLNAPTNITAGQGITLILTQDGVGGRLLTANSAYKFASSFNTLSAGAGAVDMLNIFYDGSTYYVTLTVGYE